METFFADTYAFFEYLNGNPKYIPYFKNNKIIASKLNLMELYYGTLIGPGQKLAEAYYNSFISIVVDFNDFTIKQAMQFRAKNKHMKFSYVDSMGYQLALQNSVKFLTSDKAFEGLPNVEFVK
mgnify:CR=1 FL=1